MQKKLKWVFALLVLLCLTTLTAVILSSFQWIKLKRTQKTLSQAEQTIIKLSPPAAHTPTQPSASETDLAIAWIQNLITPSSPSQSQISPQPLLKKDQSPYTVLPWKKVTSHHHSHDKRLVVFLYTKTLFCCRKIVVFSRREFSEGSES
jgi:hypothetical protein